MEQQQPDPRVAAMMDDRWAPIRRVKLADRLTGYDENGGDIMGKDFANRDQLGDFFGKYTGGIKWENDEKTLFSRQGLNQPGQHKYNTSSATWGLDPATGEYVMRGDPTDGRAGSTVNFVRQGIAQGALAAGALYGAGVAGAGSGAGGATTAGLSSADKLALFGANGYGSTGFTAAEAIAAGGAGGAGAAASGATDLGQIVITGAKPAAGGLGQLQGALASSAVGAAGNSASYSNEGDNYKNPGSTQGRGGSPANAGDSRSWFGVASDWLQSRLTAPSGGTGGGMGNNWLRDALGLVGAGVNQWNIERVAKDDRDWRSAEKDKDRAYTDRKETEKRARQAPVNVGRGSLSVFRKG